MSHVKDTIVEVPCWMLVGKQIRSRLVVILLANCFRLCLVNLLPPFIAIVRLCWGTGLGVFDISFILMVTLCWVHCYCNWKSCTMDLASFPWLGATPSPRLMSLGFLVYLV